MREYSFAVATVASTFVLLVLGGLVHATGSSLACPDWPLCGGRLVAPMQDGVLFHQGHRFSAVAVGALTLALAVGVWRSRREPGARALAAIAVALVLVQAAVGALAVRDRVPLAAATAHLALSVSLFAILIVLAHRLRPAELPRGAPGPRALVGIAAATAFASILLGGLVRHGGAAMACGGDGFLCRDAIWPAGSVAAQLHMAHRLLAAALAVLTVAAVLPAALRSIRERETGRTALALGALALLLGQVALGQVALLSALAPIVATMHSAAGSLLLGLLVALYLALGPPAAPQPPGPLRRRLAPA